MIVLRRREPDTPTAVPRAAADLGPHGLGAASRDRHRRHRRLFVNGTDWIIGGLVGVLTGPIAYLIFKTIYKGTTDEALEGSTLTPDGELPAFAVAAEGVQA